MDAITGTVSATVTFNPFTTTAVGTHGETIVSSVMPIYITTSVIRTSLTSSKVTYTTPAMTQVTVPDLTGFAIGQIVEVSEGGNDANKEITVLTDINTSLSFITIKPALVNVHPAGAIVAVPGTKGVSYDTTHPGIVAARIPITISSNITSFTFPFQPKIIASVIISANASGINVLYTNVSTISASVVISSHIGSNSPIAAIVQGVVVMEMDAFATYLVRNGAIAASIVISPNIIGGRPLVYGTIAKPITVSGTVVGHQNNSGIVSQTISIKSTISATTSSTNSLYGIVKMNVAALAVFGYQRGTIAIPIACKVAAVGQTTSPNIPFGNAALNLAITVVAKGTISPVGGTFDTPIMLPITGKAIGKSYLSTGVLTPSNLNFGPIVSTITITSTIIGSQYADQIVATIEALPIPIRAIISATSTGNSGTISAPLVISGFLRDGDYGISIAKLNVLGVVSGQDAAQLVKTNAQALVINVPSSEHVTKAVAYAVVGPTVATAGDSGSYQAVLFF